MPEQIQITLFTFDELSEESQQRVIEPSREAYEPHYDIIYEDFVNNMSEKYGSNVAIDDIQWTGFWSQGDGASFVCEFDEEVIFSILKERLSGGHEIQQLEELGVRIHHAASIRSPSHYVHENTVHGHLIFNVPDGKEFDVEIADTLEEALTEIIREECRNLYSQLQDFYEEETSADAIREKIRQYYPACRYREDGTVFVR